MWSRLLIGWISGTVASVAGLVISYRYDLSAGPAIVGVLTILLVSVALAHTLFSSPRPLKTLFKITAGLSVPAILLFLLYVTSPLGRGEDGTHGYLHHGGAEVENHPVEDPAETGHPKGSHTRHLLNRFLETPDDEETLTALRDHVSGLIHLLRNESTDVREAAATVLGKIGDGPIVEKELDRAFLSESDEWVRFEIARSLFALDQKKGSRELLILMNDEGVPTFLKSEAAGMLRDVTGSGYEYDPEGTDVANREAIEEWKAYFDSPSGQ